jgi:5'-3' exoribonuclease 1
MGIPKFFRWMSQRYPLLSQVVSESEVGCVGFAGLFACQLWLSFVESKLSSRALPSVPQVPSFDALYLDMNGIIHQCSHGNNEDPNFKITEEQIFADVAEYIECLFRIIKPRDCMNICCASIVCICGHSAVGST